MSYAATGQLYTKLTTVFILLDGCSVYYAHIWSKSGLSISWRHLVTSKEWSNPIFSGKYLLLHHWCATFSEQPSYIKTMKLTNYPRCNFLRRATASCTTGFLERWGRAGPSRQSTLVCTNKSYSTYIYVHCTGQSSRRRDSTKDLWLEVEFNFPGFVHGIYIRWYLINKCARKEHSLLFDLYKAFD